MNVIYFECQKCMRKSAKTISNVNFLVIAGIKREHEIKAQHYKGHQEISETFKNQFGSESLGKGEYPCLKCKAVLKFKKTWTNHMQKYHKDFSVGEKSTNNNFCKTCDKTFKNISTFKTHLRNFHEGVTFDCPRCNLKFHQKSGLKTHTTKYPNCTNKIKKEYNDKQDKQIQAELKMMDSQEKAQDPHKCSQCSASFSTKSILDSHVLILHKPFGFRAINESKHEKINHKPLLNNKSNFAKQTKPATISRFGRKSETTKSKMNLKINAVFSLKD